MILRSNGYVQAHYSGLLTECKHMQQETSQHGDGTSSPRLPEFRHTQTFENTIHDSLADIEKGYNVYVHQRANDQDHHQAVQARPSHYRIENESSVRCHEIGCPTDRFGYSDPKHMDYYYGTPTREETISNGGYGRPPCVSQFDWDDSGDEDEAGYEGPKTPKAKPYGINR